MHNITLNVFLQVIMAVGLLMVVYLLITPVFSGLFGSNKLIENRSVLEITESRNGSQRMVVTRIKNMLDRNPDAKIEVVAVNNGVNLLLKSSAQKHAIQSLLDQGVTFTVCQNSLQRLAKESTASIELLPGVRLTENGYRYAEQLKDNGYIDELA